MCELHEFSEKTGKYLVSSCHKKTGITQEHSLNYDWVSYQHINRTWLQNNAMRVRLAVTVLINSTFIHVRENVAAGFFRINMAIRFTNRKSPIHSESVPRSRSKANTFSYAGKKALCLSHFIFQLIYIYIFFFRFITDIFRT